MVEYIYEDDSIIVCVKPAGIPVETRSVGQMDMSGILRNHRLSKGEAPEIFTIHRLDQPVEGLMVFAKNASAAARLNSQLAKEGFSKIYLCVVSSGNLLQREELTDYIFRDGRTNLSSVVDEADKRGKKARLEYEIQKRSDDGRTLLKVRLYTGRHHQIRCQLANRGAAIIGDVKYGGVRTGRPLALCSCSLIFSHPEDGRKMEFSCQPSGQDFADLL